MTMRRATCLFTLALCMAMISIVMPLRQAYAQPANVPEISDEQSTAASEGENSTVNADNETVKCSDYAEAAGGAVLGVIIPCMVYTVEQATYKFTEAMVDLLRPIMYMFLLLVVVLYGVRVAQNEPEIHKQGFLLLLKIAIVAIVLNDLGNAGSYDGGFGEGKIISSVYYTMSESQQVIVDAIQGNSNTLNCEIAKFEGPDTPRIWATMDCVMGKLFGYELGEETDADGNRRVNMVLASSMFGMLSGFLFSGAWGVVIFFGMLGVLVSVFSLIARTAIAFISSYLMICFMLVILPLFLPLVFLRATTSYYENVWKIMLAGFLTPILVTSYAMFALLLYDRVLFAPDSITQRLFNYENVKDAQLQDKNFCDYQVTGDPGETRFQTNNATPQQMNDAYRYPALQNFIIRTLSGANNPCTVAQVPNLDVEKIEGFNGKRADYEKMFGELISLLIIAWLINQGMVRLRPIVTKIVGKGSAMATSHSIVSDNPIRNASGNMRQSMTSRFNGADGKSVSGSEFLRSVPGATAGSIKDSLSAFVKR